METGNSGIIGVTETRTNINAMKESLDKIKLLNNNLPMTESNLV